MSDKIFLIGGTGDIGSKLVNFLLKKNADITLYVRNVEKTRELYPNANNLRIVQGDYTTTDAFEREIQGHNRLFILVATSYQMPAYKGNFAKIAYGAGVRQIVDISSYSVNLPFRSGFISAMHRGGEERILAEKRDGQYYVALRPGHFLTSVFQLYGKSIKENQAFEVVDDLDHKNDYISTVDIAELASIILTEPIEKHCDTVYTMIGESLSPNEVADVLSDVLSKPVKGKKIPMQDRYNALIARGMPHYLAYELVSLQDIYGLPPYFSIVLGRPPQTLREWLQTDFDLSSLQ